MLIKSLLILLQFYINKLFGKRHTSVKFADLSFDFDLHWKHEFYYHQYIQHNKINGPICMDAWVISNLLQDSDIVLDAGANIGFTAALSKKPAQRKYTALSPIQDYLKGCLIFVEETTLNTIQWRLVT